MEFRFSLEDKTVDKKKIEKKLRAIYSDESLGKGNFIPQTTPQGNPQYYIEFDKSYISFFLARKNENRKTLFEEISKSKKAKSALRSFKLGTPTYVSREEEKPQEWSQHLQRDGSEVWLTEFCHNGVIFHDYQPHGKAFKFAGKSIKYPKDLNLEEEQALTFYAQKLASESQNPKNIKHTQNPTFNKNYYNSLKEILQPQNSKLIKSLKDIDFSTVVNFVIERSKARKKLSASEKRQEQKKKLSADDTYGWVSLDGMKQQFTGYKVEAPGIFIGRGESPLKGTIKKIYQPNDIKINIDKDCIIPIPPNYVSSKIPRERGNIPWKEITHNPNVRYVASFFDPITKDYKHQYLSQTSTIKAKSDQDKYDKARKLHWVIDDIRKENEVKLNSKNIHDKQIATVLWLIDKAAIRVGGEKKEDETDTVGATTLRMEHVKILKDSIKLAFLGKDSVPYENKFKAPPIIRENMQLFLKDKSKNDLVFNQISAKDINEYLKSFMIGLSAKVFRTYHASKKFVAELQKSKVKKSEDALEKVTKYNLANISVAKLCNHRRGVEVNDEKVEKLHKDIEDIDEKLKVATGKRVQTLETQKRKKEITINEIKEGGGELSCTTSKANYLDPRITVAWAEKFDVPIEKLFTATLRKKYDWAIKTTAKNWKFIDENMKGQIIVPTEISIPTRKIGTKSGTKKTATKKSTTKRTFTKKTTIHTLQKGDLFEFLQKFGKNFNAVIDTALVCSEKIEDSEALNEIISTKIPLLAKAIEDYKKHSAFFVPTDKGVYLAGNTYTFKDDIKSSGGTWNGSYKAWYFAGKNIGNVGHLLDLGKPLVKREEITSGTNLLVSGFGTFKIRGILGQIGKWNKELKGYIVPLSQKSEVESMIVGIKNITVKETEV